MTSDDVLRRTLLLAVSACWLSRAIAVTPAPPRKDSPGPALLRDRIQIGVATHYGMRGEPTKTFEALAAMGVDGLRDEAYWDHVESPPGVFNVPKQVAVWYELATRSRLQPLLLLSYTHPAYQNGARPTTAPGRAGFARYAAFVARALPGVRQFQIWNEWELVSKFGEPGLAQDYLSLVREVAPVLRSERPGALILPAGVHRAGFFNGYLESLVRGGLLGLVDGIALHTYRFSEPDPSPEAWYAEMRRLGENIAVWDPLRGPSAALYVTEMGFPSHWGRQGVSPTLQADYLERCLLLALLVPRLRGFWWYGLRNKGYGPWESEHHYGLLEPEGAPKPSSIRLQGLMKRLRSANRVALISQQADRWVVQLEEADGSVWLAQWSPAADSSGAVNRAGLGPRPAWSLLRGPESLKGVTR
jgi:polysaccharide biosynthesis protein PslG